MQKCSLLLVGNSFAKQMVYTVDQITIAGGNAGFASIVGGSPLNNDDTFVVNSVSHASLLSPTSEDMKNFKELMLKVYNKKVLFDSTTSVITSSLIGYGFLKNYNDSLALKEYESFDLSDTDSMSVDLNTHLTNLGLDTNGFVMNPVAKASSKCALPFASYLATPDETKSYIDPNDYSALYKTGLEHQNECFKNDVDFQIVSHLVWCNFGYNVDDKSRAYIGFYLHGEAGATKSSFADSIANVTGLPMYSVTCNESTKVSTIIKSPEPNNDETSLRNFIVAESPLMRLLPLTMADPANNRKASRVILNLDEGNEAVPNFLKVITSAWTEGVFIIKSDIIEFDIRNLIIFVTANPDKKKKVENSVFSRLLLIRRRNRTLIENFKFNLPYATTKTDENLFVVSNPFSELVNVKIQDTNGIGVVEQYDIPTGKYRIEYHKASTFELPPFGVDNSFVDFNESDQYQEVDVDGIVLKDVMPKLNLEYGESRLNAIDLYRIQYFYDELLMSYILRTQPLSDQSACTNDHYISKLDERHFRYFLHFIFIFGSVGFAAYYMLYNIIQSEVTKFEGASSTAYVTLTNEQQALKFAKVFCDLRSSEIASLQSRLFNDNSNALSTALTDFNSDFKSTGSAVNQTLYDLFTKSKNNKATATATSTTTATSSSSSHSVTMNAARNALRKGKK